MGTALMSISFLDKWCHKIVTVFKSFANMMLFKISKQIVLPKASGNSKQGLMVFEVGRLFWHCFYFPVIIYSCQQRNKCNQTVPTKRSQTSKTYFYGSTDLTKKSQLPLSL